MKMVPPEYAGNLCFYYCIAVWHITTYC